MYYILANILYHGKIASNYFLLPVINSNMVVSIYQKYYEMLSRLEVCRLNKAFMPPLSFCFDLLSSGSGVPPPRPRGPPSRGNHHNSSDQEAVPRWVSLE